MAQPRPNNALQEFFHWESQSWVEIVANLETGEKAHFMPSEALKSYFAAEDGEALSKILTGVFQTRFPPVDPESILRDHTAVFCILLHIGEGQHIEEFVRYEELSDRRLPFDFNRPPAEFPLVQHNPRLFNRFCELQLAYCVPIFDGHMIHKHFGSQRLLPITKQQPCMEGSTKLVIELYGPHNKLIPAAQRTTGSPQSNTIVLQRYPKPGGDDLYNEKVNGFRSVRNTDSIRRFYGSYIHGGHFNIMLEHANGGTLEEYLRRENPPSRGPDIVRLWEALFQLLRGLKTIHSVREGHHDISPQNILVFGDIRDPGSDCKFKFSSFGKSSIPDQSFEAGGQDPRSSPTYDAPESYMPYSTHENRNSKKLTWEPDIWSVGCIYSEVAMWIADGYRGLLDYRQQRLSETERILFSGGDCFHDGERVLQAVLDAHMDIEDRLRKSDYITKDVLDSMIDEMLWEEDRPSAKALVRKADMVLSRARQKLAATSNDELSRSGSSLSRPIPPVRLQPPSQPLPPLPRTHSVLASVEERPLASVETWRSQVTSLPLSQQASNRSTIESPTLTMNQLRRGPSIQNSETGSVASWQQGDNNSVSSPLTPFTSPHMSYNEDMHRHIPNEGRPRTLMNQHSFESRNSPPKVGPPSYAAPYPNNDMTYAPQSPPPPPKDQRRVYVQPDVSQMDTNSLDSLPSQNRTMWNGDSPHPPPLRVGHQTQDTVPATRASSRAGSRHSSLFSLSSPPTVKSEVGSMAETQTRPKSQKKSSSFSLFPKKVRATSNPLEPQPQRLEKTFTHDSETLPQSSINSRPSTIGPDSNYLQEPITYVSLQTCIDHKNSSKKAKKAKQHPLLPSSFISFLSERDHCFILDDSTSMRSIWPDMRRVFGGLSHSVKGFGPLGTELFFTISYDTWLRKDPADLEKFLELKAITGDTDIAYRLNLQLQTFTYRWNTYKNASEKERLKKKMQPVRPLSFYILTNGEWQKGDKVKPIIFEIVDFLKKEGLEARNMITVQFISFAMSPSAIGKLDDLKNTDFGADVVDVTSSNGNVLKMLRGCLDKDLTETESSGEKRREEPDLEMEKLHAFPMPARQVTVNELE